MPSLFEILGNVFGVPVLPPAGDPGFSQPSTQPPPLQYPQGYGKPEPKVGASAGGAMGPLDPNSPGYQAGQAANGVWNHLTSVLEGIGLDFHNGLQGLQEGLPIFGTFAVLTLIFLAGLIMFLAEGEKAVVREVLPISK